METIKTKDFTIIIDYAHEPSSLEAVYKTVSSIKYQVSGDENSKIICLLGAQGGGRDKWKRPAMGKIAAQYCDEIILTNEDPYDEQPEKIIEEIFSGYSQIRNLKSRAYPYLPINRQQADKIQNVYKIIDRKEAVKKALSLAKKGDIVVLTGKGGESWICVENGKKIPWDERKVVEETLSENFKI